MKRYLVFGGEVFYPNGGMQDFQSDHEELTDAVKAAEEYSKAKHDEPANGVWSEVFDSQTMKACFRYGNSRLDEYSEFGSDVNADNAN